MATIVRIVPTSGKAIEKPVVVSLNAEADILADAIRIIKRRDYTKLYFRIFKSEDEFLASLPENEWYSIVHISSYTEFRDTFLYSLENYFHEEITYTRCIPTKTAIKTFGGIRKCFSIWKNGEYHYMKLRGESHMLKSAYHTFLAMLDNLNVRYKECANYTVGFDAEYSVEEDVLYKHGFTSEEYTEKKVINIK